MKESFTNVPVALIFFARPDVLEITFQAIRKVRPKKIFLIQDGPRINRPDDIENIKKCREIVERIDWDCEVFKDYSEKNLGCGMRIYSGLNWAFNYVDRLAVIEDDCVPSKSFFDFSEELLERFLCDERIGMISGMNNLGYYEMSEHDYFFTEYGSVWGWATWKRVWETVDFNMGFLNDKDAERLITNLYGSFFYNEGKRRISKINNGVKLTSWSYQFGLNMFLNSYLTIVPKSNLISNIGLTANSANTLSTVKYTPKALRSLYYMCSYKLEFPLNHPKYIIKDIEYKKKMDRLMGNGYPLVKLYRLAESIIYRILDGDFKSILKGLKRRMGINN
jgi:hypothetical protein